MKRYRLLNADFDGRESVLWNHDPRLDAVREEVIEQMKGQYGSTDFTRKLLNWTSLGRKPYSITAFHNQFLTQARDAFVVGCYYPSLTATCALGERILNHMWLSFKHDYASPPKLTNKGALNDWVKLIGTMVDWGFLLPEVARDFKLLEKARQQAIHFRPEVDIDARPLALDALRLLQSIIEGQFSSHGDRPWYITGFDREVYIKREWEESPYIKRLYLQHCVLVGPKHAIRGVNPWRVEDKEYPDGQVSDDEFVILRTKFRR